MTKTDIVIIGSSAAGLTAALTAKTIYSDKDLTVINKDDQTLVPCGIPYFIRSDKSTDKNIMISKKMFEEKGINIKINEVVSIDKNNKTCKLKNNEEISFEKLIIATGSSPVKPGWLKGRDLENVFVIPKDKVYLDNMKMKLKDQKKIIVIGAGFIGVEISDELNKDGKDITLVEKLPNILALAFDQSLSAKAEEELKERGINIKTGVGVKEITGKGKVSGVMLDNGESMEADAVFLAMGYRPNIDLAKNSGINITETGFIEVDEYMRTSASDIFAVGDCAEKRDFFTRKPSNIMLASTGASEARLATINLFKLSAVKTFSGTIAVFSTAIGNTAFGVAGLTETRAIEEGFDIITGVFEGMDKHPGSLPDTNKQIVKLITGRETGIILGGEVIGGPSTGELTNTIGFIIQNRMDINGLLTSQIGTQPLLTGSPVIPPLVKAAEAVLKERMVQSK